MLHAQQQQRQRFKALDRFKGDAHGVLVATDVAARGLDILGVRCVVQYQLPPTADTYIHRAGRTARADARGACVAFVVPSEAARFRGLHAALGRDAPATFPVDWTVLPDAQVSYAYSRATACCCLFRAIVAPVSRVASSHADTLRRNFGSDRPVVSLTLASMQQYHIVSLTLASTGM